MKFDRVKIAERLQDLRPLSMSLKRLSEEIEQKTGKRISHTMLHKYENTDLDDVMNIENLMALSSYYDVSFDYLLGVSDSKKRKNININQRIGLSDRSIDILENWTEIVHESKPVKGGHTIKLSPNELNSLIEHPKFAEMIYYIRALSYLNVSDNNEDMKVSNPVFAEETVKRLENQFGYKFSREYITSEAIKAFRTIIDETYPPSGGPEKPVQVESMKEFLGF